MALGDPGFGGGYLPPAVRQQLGGAIRRLPRRQSMDPGFGGRRPQQMPMLQMQPQQMQPQMQGQPQMQQQGQMQAYNLDPGGAAQRVGNALAASQGQSRGMPQDVSGPALGQPGQPGQLPQQVMKYMPDGTPVYYGTPEAEQLALAGLDRVRRGYGKNSAQFQHALQAAMGVVGPKYSRDALTTGLAAPSTGY